MEKRNVKLPIWFWIVAVVFLLWNIIGVMSFVGHTFITEEAISKLPSAERELYESYPQWATIVFAIAVFFGITGSLGLILKQKWCKMAFIISLFAIIIQMSHNVFFTKSIAVYGLAQAITMPILLVVIGTFLVWFSKYSSHKGWLK